MDASDKKAKERLAMLQSEIRLLKQLKHDNIVGYVGVGHDQAIVAYDCGGTSRRASMDRGSFANRGSIADLAETDPTAERTVLRHIANDRVGMNPAVFTDFRMAREVSERFDDRARADDHGARDHGECFHDGVGMDRCSGINDCRGMNVQIDPKPLR